MISVEIQIEIINSTNLLLFSLLRISINSNFVIVHPNTHKNIFTIYIEACINYVTDVFEVNMVDFFRIE